MSASDKTICLHYGLPRVDGAGCPDCNFEEGVEAVIACLGDDAQTLRDVGGIRNEDSDFTEIVSNMEAAAKHLQYFLDSLRLSLPSSGDARCQICGAEMPCHCNDMEGLG